MCGVVRMPKVSKDKAKKDKAWRENVLTLGDNKCAICGKADGRLNAHHLIPKEFAEFRWESGNGMVLCVHHHTLGKLSAHKNPVWFVMWLSKYKKDTLAKMYERMRNYI